MQFSENVTISDVMRSYANGAVQYARSRHGLELDFSEASLENIDRILGARVHEGGVHPNQLSQADEEDLWLYCKMIGGYVGEVIIRNLGGTWLMEDHGPDSSSVKLMAAQKIQGYPPDSIWRALTESGKSVVSYYRTLLVILGQGNQTIDGHGEQTFKLHPLSSVPPM